MIHLDQDRITWGGDVTDAIGHLLFDLREFSDEEVGTRLASLISAVSEAAYFATWHDGIEWLAFEGRSPFGWYEEPALILARDRLKGGWVCWRGDGVYLLDAAEWAAAEAEL